MPLTPASRHLRRWACVLPLLVLVAGACSPGHYPQTSLRPLSDFARIGDDIQNNTLYWATGVFVLVEGALLYAIFRFRGRPDDPEPRQVHGNTVIEIIWTVIPALILAAIAVPTVRGIFQTNAIPTGDVLRVDVVGHQWWWEFRYPTLNLTTANELHIPVGQTVSLHLGSADVVHSFWPPRFAGKRDVFPNRETRLWFKAEQAGEYPGQCAEFCGIQHGRMAFRVRAQSPAEFQTWVAHMQTLGVKPAPAAAAPAKDSVHTASAGARVQSAPQTSAPTGPQSTAQAAPTDPAYAAGEKLFAAKGCVGCHSLTAVNAPKGMVGPNLANVGARTYIAAGTLKNTDENLAHWIRDPQGIKKGVLMPNLGVTADEARSLVAFLRAHQ
ncbi:MAG TPA: cytochrome c oxidase subunit II [Gemmatimonadales bacterium]|jgi:cytochrome c oxidase subunit 2|nr:cytochrome c oxidase subunit II [Gemmatimonadales bacterium]